ncbi:Phosphatidylinositolglycan class N-domain-containing protein [Phakopsora pachyrhizi]|uniref:GPI ethanolamine phosphate transferase 1 n=1 Tax=Phakopsora pachyrhizi TaxID=170000 RepID=A0AAV0BTX9_PHAPC|nr:Phosphatidylinositolglycan class N-domain-containing protein [Phakopsora pachyrhizi]KAI8448817.1 Phosphatidylinositolglycan class N-domain-containing protein [Phakopsora pachyrhizi]CAH7689895.1 Phosphatidylinositolglycan class N-domain-containing protein [Phakopsora pachyrhizi]
MTNSKVSSGIDNGAKWLLLVGFLFHATYLGSIFDIYFVSPVVRVNKRFSMLDHIPGEPASSRETAKPLASRVVLFVGDGLRADKLFSLFPDPPFDPPLATPTVQGLKGATKNNFNSTNLMTPAPYIRSLIESGQASWGVSHTRVPTESRPGHVALIAGMYEDVSAVTRGWKMNPVNFDSFFNQSFHSFTFGSPDILPMFKHGASDPSRVDAWSYNEEDEDFTQDATKLDLWVLDRLQQLLLDAREAGPGSMIDERLRSDQVVFFLHLLGLDTTGHSYRPHSPEYLRNIQVVDQIVQRTQELLDEFYDDDRTAYIFTADHGMSNIGNHGDGDPDNTRTPLVAWGSGVQWSTNPGNFIFSDSLATDPYFHGWDLDMTKRKDVEQADIAALMAALAGSRVPSNSVGRLPSTYLNASTNEIARAAYANTRQILQQYESKRDLKAATKFAFRPFSELPEKESLRKPSITERLYYIHRLILTGRDLEAIKACAELQDLALKGLKYLQSYDWFLLRTIVTAGYVGWILYSAVFVLRTYVLPIPVESSGILSIGHVAGFLIFLAISLWFYLERAPFSYYLYVMFPAYFWARIVDQLDSWQDLIDWTSTHSTSTMNPWLAIIGSWLALECMVWGYFHRIAWTVGWVFVGIIWPALSIPRLFKETNRPILKIWCLSSVSTGIFTLLPVEKGESLIVISIGALAFLFSGKLSRSLGFYQPSRAQLSVIGISLLITIHSVYKLRQKSGLPVINRAAGWLVLVGSSLSPFFSKKRSSRNISVGSRLISRAIEVIFAYAPAFIILSISYETLFYLSFSFSLLVWHELEIRLADFNQFIDNSSRPQKAVNGGTKVGLKFRLEHFRLSLFFLFFVHVGFFGTGNVGSVSSFYLEPVYRLVPIFNPFLMSTLLVLKILIPFLIVSVVFTILNHRLGFKSFTLFISSLVCSDVLTMNFFYLVKDFGSWLEIGRSISHFAISSLLLVFMIFLNFVGEIYLYRFIVRNQTKKLN